MTFLIVLLVAAAIAVIGGLAEGNPYDRGPNMPWTGGDK